MAMLPPKTSLGWCRDERLLRSEGQKLQYDVPSYVSQAKNQCHVQRLIHQRMAAVLAFQLCSMTTILLVGSIDDKVCLFHTDSLDGGRKSHNSARSVAVRKICQ